jgi:hypothetical protein
MKEIFLGLLSIGMVSCYITSAIYCGLNLWFNRSVIDPILKKAFECFFIATFAMIICGYDWIVNMDYMKIPTWQALGWGVIHISMPTGFILLNDYICQYLSLMKCDVIREKVSNMFAIKNTLHTYVGSQLVFDKK